MPRTEKIASKHIPDHSRPISGHILYKNTPFYEKNAENRENSIKILKKFKIVAKAKLGIHHEHASASGLGPWDCVSVRLDLWLSDF